MNRNMPFSWKALLVSPLLIPLAVTVLFWLLSPPPRVPQTLTESLTFYSLILLLGCFISYGAVIFLLAPALFIVSRFVALKAWIAGLVGMAAGVLVYLCHLWVWYRSSGPDSGPPIGSFPDFLRCHDDLFGWDCWSILGAGLATAMLYWLMLNRRENTKIGAD